MRVIFNGNVVEEPKETIINRIIENIPSIVIINGKMYRSENIGEKEIKDGDVIDIIDIIVGG